MNAVPAIVQIDIIDSQIVSLVNDTQNHKVNPKLTLLLDKIPATTKYGDGMSKPLETYTLPALTPMECMEGGLCC